MRIISGKFKGRKISTVRDLSVRPVTDRVKSTIFNVLQNRLDLRGSSVLDLFAGSGSLGFEALSRGAAHVVFVEESRRTLDLIDRTSGEFGCEEQTTLILSDAESFLRKTTETFNLVFTDPPYAYNDVPGLADIVFSRRLLKNGGFLIIEHIKKVDLANGPAFTVAVRKEFGNTRVSFLTHVDSSTGSACPDQNE